MSVAACRPKQKRARHTLGNVGMDFSGLNSRHLRQGKHRFATFQQVAANDRMYCAWVIHAPPRSLPPTLAMFKQYLLGKHGGVVRVGKFKSLFFDFQLAFAHQTKTNIGKEKCLKSIILYYIQYISFYIKLFIIEILSLQSKPIFIFT